MEVKIKRLNDNAILPQKAHKGDACFDLVATSMEYDEYGNVVYGFGWAFEIPENHVGLLFPRSSLSKYDMIMKGHVGVIDSCFRGEVKAKFRPDTIIPLRKVKTGTIEVCMANWAEIYKIGDRVAQLMIIPLPLIDFVESEELSETDRNTNGYGSSGR